MTSEQNRRKFPRAHYPCFLTLWQGKSFDTIEATTANIGAGGVLVHSPQGIMVGAKVGLKIDFSKKDPFQCEGLISRCQKNREDPDEFSASYSVAIVFEGLNEPKVSYLKELIEKLITSESNN